MFRKTLTAIFAAMFLFGTSYTSAQNYEYLAGDFEYYEDDDDEDDYFDDDDYNEYFDDEDDNDDNFDEYFGDDEDNDEDYSNQSSNDESEYAQQILNLVNIERRKAGVSPLKLSRDLNDAADIRAEEITQVFSHTRPDGSKCFTVIEGNYYNVGENIAAGHATAEATMNQWMNSPGHRGNILNSDFTELGVGYFYAPGSEYKHYWVQLFRRPR